MDNMKNGIRSLVESEKGDDEVLELNQLLFDRTKYVMVICAELIDGSCLDHAHKTLIAWSKPRVKALAGASRLTFFFRS